ncbi:MAG: SDR family oxidoreductase [Streptomycetaceae bacterium]|nr:SDR family oxidoreductase [Streptomycetaceae bacterium]
MSTATALVTGAARGIGRAVCERLAAEGIAVALLGRSADSLAPLHAELTARGSRVTAVAADVNDPDAVHRAVRTTEDALGPIDLVVNNAGLIDAAEVPFWEADQAQWWDVVETNLRGPANVDRAVLPGMVARGRGRIVNVNSGFALRADPDYSAYSTSKAALLRLTDALAPPLAAHGVYVFDISPGAVATDMTAGMPMFAGRTDWYDKDLFLDAVLAVAEGRLDALSGRFIHAGKDDLDALAARAADIAEQDARRLHLRPYGTDDPVA